MLLEWYERASSRAWFRGEWSARWFGALATLGDSVVRLAELAALARYPSTCPPDALVEHGRAWGLERVPGETVAEYRSRIRTAFELARLRGKVGGIEAALASIGLSAEVREAIDPAWTRVGPSERAFWVIIRPPHEFGTDFAFRWGDGTAWGDAGAVWGVDSDLRLLEAVYRLIDLMRPAHAPCAEILLVLSGDVDASTGEPTPGSVVVPIARS